MKTRLDQFLVANNLAKDLNVARSLIIQKMVYVGNNPSNKPGTLVPNNSNNITVKKSEHDYVSRGALKLIAALERFKIDPSDLVCLDIGSSTGGFTELLLRRDAAHIFSVDVGYGELHYKLRNDSKISVIERTNARYLTRLQIPLKPDLIVCDASFISLMTILPTSFELASRSFTLIALIKPQFEAKRHEVSKTRGIILDSHIKQRICATILRWLENEYGFSVAGIIPSPILGAKGNQEFLICAKKNP